MPGRCNKLDSEASEIPPDGSEDVDIRFACVASSGADLTQTDGTTQQRNQPGPEVLRKTELAAGAGPEDEIVLFPNRHPVIVGVRNGLCRAYLNTGSAEQASSEVEFDPILLCAADCLGRTDIHAGVACVQAVCGIQLQGSSVPVGECGSRPVWIGDGFATRLDTMEQNIEGGHGKKGLATGRIRSRTG